jgi:hypothetical protein
VKAFDQGVSRALHRSTSTGLGGQHLLKTR